jgi:hypothetical protein
MMLGGKQVSSGERSVIAVTQMRDHILIRYAAAAGSNLWTVSLSCREIAVFSGGQKLGEQTFDLRNQASIFCR